MGQPTDTRAKKRVYIVGSIADWGIVPNFSTLAQYMKESDQVIGVEEALDRFQKARDDSAIADPSRTGESALERKKTSTTAVSPLATSANEACDKELSDADCTYRDATLNWRTLVEIWEEMREANKKAKKKAENSIGFRVVRKSYHFRYTGLQYTHVTEKNGQDNTAYLSGSYTRIENNLETRTPYKEITKLDDATWVTLEEALSHHKALYSSTGALGETLPSLGVGRPHLQIAL